MPRTIEDLTPGWNASTRSMVRAEALTTAFKRYRTALAELALAEAAYLFLEEEDRKARALRCKLPDHVQQDGQEPSVTLHTAQ